MGGMSSGPQQLQTFFNGGTYFQIVLDSANFHEGSLVTGNVQFQLTSHQPFLEVFVAILGYETVYWKEEHQVGSGENRRTEVYIRNDTNQC